MLTVLPFLTSLLLSADTLLVSPAWLSAHLGQPGMVVIQVDRRRAAYDSGHIAGSVYLPMSSIVVERDGIPNELPPVEVLDSALEAIGIGDGTRVIITGDPLGAARLFFTLDYLGHGGRASLLDGGTPAWIAAGFPVTGAIDSAVRALLTPRPRPDVLVDAEWVRAHLDDPAVALLDARPGADFLGTPGSTPRSGHIPGARNIYWRLTMQGSPPALQSDAVLKELFSGAGVVEGQLIVTCCQRGLQASFLYFVARYLGYEVRMYDGSFAEWSQLAGMPIEQGAGE